MRSLVLLVAIQVIGFAEKPVRVYCFDINYQEPSGSFIIGHSELSLDPSKHFWKDRCKDDEFKPGPQLQAFARAVPGTQPVYRYRKMVVGTPKVNGDYNGTAVKVPMYFYSFNPDETYFGVKDGVAFHAFQFERDGLLRVQTGKAVNLLPGDFELVYNYERLRFQKPSFNPKKELIETRTILQRGGKTGGREEITLSRTRTVSYQLNLRTTLSVGAEVGVNANFPFNAGGVDARLKTNIDLEKSESTTQSIEQTISVTKTVEFAPNERKVVTGYVDWDDNVTVPFEMLVRVQGKSSKYPGGVLNGAALKILFESMNPNIPVRQVQSDAVLFAMEGEMKGSMGLNTYTEVNAEEIR
jgi:hypothetical protein